MENRVQGNQTVVEFLLLGFGHLPDLQPLLFLLFLMIYLATMAGNLLIVVLVVADRHLHTPMYFFLGNLACLEICYSSALLPRLLAGLLTGDRSVSVQGCLVQFYFFGALVGTECFLLSVMSYDRYVAICHPLRYALLMNGRFCLHLAVGSWMSGFLAMIIIILSMAQLTFCGPREIDSFFCDFIPILQLSCSDLRVTKAVAFIGSSVFSAVPFVLTLTSYMCIIATILRIPSTAGKQKAFSTCSSHLIVVSIYYGTLIVAYMQPNTDALRDLNKVFSVFYTVVTPLVNPLVYSLRNAEVKEALRKAQWKCVTLVSNEECRGPSRGHLVQPPVWRPENQGHPWQMIAQSLPKNLQ
uniref:Olfactory receptor n=1 Tax=Pelodiscus sinensis TaxID=13735 RepID=K7F022_PELSI|nr:olfactory receptor 11A1-like [Pelodiscus sinensis]|eukprot:XP_014431115.1 olfactory receptor 11A1-like [Pelodiscus sinensis]